MSGESDVHTQRPSLLILNLYMVYPPDSGAKVVIYNRVVELSKDFRITFCCLAERPEDVVAAGVLSSFAEVVIVKGRRERGGWWWRCRDMLADPCALPFAEKLVTWLDSDEVESLLARRFDLVEIHSSCWYRRSLRRAAGLKVVVAHNRERQYYAQRARAAWQVASFTDFLRSLADFVLVSVQERRAIAQCDAVVSLAPLTERQRRRWLGARPLLCNWGGIDLEYYRDGDARSRERTPVLVFIAALFVESAAEAAERFVADAMPSIVEARPGTRLILVGDYRANATIPRLARENANVEATGLVADVRPYLRAADVVVVPILHGSGVRYKIMEAMAAGKAVVSTRKGAEGLGLEEGNGILVAPTVAAMAPKVTRLLNDQSLRRNLETRARAVAAERFDRVAEHRKLARWYRELLDARR